MITLLKQFMLLLSFLVGLLLLLSQITGAHVASSPSLPYVCFCALFPPWAPPPCEYHYKGCAASFDIGMSAEAMKEVKRHAEVRCRSQFEEAKKQNACGVPVPKKEGFWMFGLAVILLVIPASVWAHAAIKKVFH